MLEWPDKPSSEQCLDSPTKLRRKKDQLDLLIQIQQKQETLILQKLTKNSILGSRKQRNQLKTMFIQGQKLEKKSSLEQFDNLDENKEDEQITKPTLENFSTTQSMMKRFQGTSPVLKLNIVKKTNFDDIDELKKVSDTQSSGSKIPQLQKQVSTPALNPYKSPTIVKNDNTDPFQKLTMEEQEEDDLNTFDDEYFSSNKKQQSVKVEQKESDDETEDDYFSNKQLIVRDKKKKNTKLSSKVNLRSSPSIIKEEVEIQRVDSSKQRMSLQILHQSHDFNIQPEKKKLLTLIQTTSSQQNHDQTTSSSTSTRETSLKDIPSFQNTFSSLQSSRQFIIKSSKNIKNNQQPKKAVSLQVVGSPSNQNDIYNGRGSFSNKSSKKSSEKIDYFSDLYQIVENQGDNNEKSSENQSDNSSDNEENVKTAPKIQNFKSTNQSSLSSIPMKSLTKRSSNVYSTTSSGSDSMYSKTSLNRILMSQNDEEQGYEESSKRDSIQENFEQNKTPSQRSKRDLLRGVKKRQTLEHLDLDFYSKNLKQSKHRNDQKGEDCFDENEDGQDNEIYSPLEKIALRSTRNNVFQPSSSSRKSTLTQQFLGNFHLNGSQNSMFSISKRQKSLMSQNSGFLSHRNDKRESIFSLFNYEDMLVKKLNEILENNIRLQKMIETVSNVDVQKFGKQCEQVIQSTIHDNIHGKIQKIIADSHLKERLSDYFYQILKKNHFDEQTLNIFSYQFSMKWHKFFTNTNLLEDMGGVDQIRLIVWNCIKKLKNKLSFNINAQACSRACIRFFASLLTDNQSAIAYYMTKLSETVLVTQMDFFQIKKALYKVLSQLSILDSGDLNFIMEKLENCRAFLFPEDFLRSNDLIRVIAETLFKSKVLQGAQYFISKDFSVILLIVEILVKLINYEVNIDDCISVLSPICTKQLDDIFFQEILKILKHFLNPLESSIMTHINHLINRLKIKLAQQNSSFPFNSCILEIDQEELFNEIEQWLEDYFQHDDLNNLTDIFDFKYIKFILTFAMDQREIFQIQDSVCAKSIYKPTTEALRFQKKALRSVLYAKLDKKYEQQQNPRRGLKLFSCVSATSVNNENSRSPSFSQSINNSQNIIMNQYQSNTQLDENQLNILEQKKQQQYKQIDILFNYLNQCTEI